MKTNFFELIAGLSISGNLQINIYQNDTGTQTVSVLLSPKDPKSTTGKNLPPMLFKASPQDLDETFFKYITEPLKQTEKVFINADAYKKELEKTQKQATTTKDSKTTTTPGTIAKAPEKGNLFSVQPETPFDDISDDDEPLDEQPDDTEVLAEKMCLYEDAMQKVNTLNGQMKYAEAIAQLPDPLDYPEKMDEIKSKGEALWKRQEIYMSLQQGI